MTKKTIVVITKDIVLTNIVEIIVKDYFTIAVFTGIQSSLDYIYNSMPDMMLIDISTDDPLSVRLLNEIKADPIFGQLPVLAIFGDKFVIPRWDYLLVDDYLRISCVEKELHAKIDLCLHRADRMVDVNPLTRLPGNIAIIKQMQKRLDKGETFAVAYADLDYFKPFNDKYGFSRGDEVLKMLGRLVLNIVKSKQPHGGFAGHIGGDDFVFVVDFELAEEISNDLIDNFDKIIPTFYDAEDRTNGSIESVDREGNKKTFPIMGVSIGIAHNKVRDFSHYGEMAEVASELKKFAKYTIGSCFRIDKRS